MKPFTRLPFSFSTSFSSALLSCAHTTGRIETFILNEKGVGLPMAEKIRSVLELNYNNVSGNQS